MKYFREYSVATLTEDGAQKLKAGIDNFDDRAWVRMYLDFELIQGFNEQYDNNGEIMVQYCDGFIRVQETYDKFKQDFDKYLEARNKPTVWLWRQ